MIRQTGDDFFQSTSVVIAQRRLREVEQIMLLWVDEPCAHTDTTPQN
jgi:hypothetical protein